MWKYRWCSTEVDEQADSKESKSVPQRLKPAWFVAYAARLKPCPDESHVLSNVEVPVVQH